MARKEALSFYDVGAKLKFMSADWKIKQKRSKGRMMSFAVANNPSGKGQAWRLVSKAFAAANK
jgi:hypothetical protein